MIKPVCNETKNFTKPYIPLQQVVHFSVFHSCLKYTLGAVAQKSKILALNKIEVDFFLME